MPQQFAGLVSITNAASNTTIMLDGNSSTITLRDNAGNPKIWLQGDFGNAIFDGDLWAGPILNPGVRSFRFIGSSGDFFVSHRRGMEVFDAMTFYSEYPTTLRATLMVGQERIRGLGGEIIACDFMGKHAVRIDGGSSRITVYDGTGTEKIRLDGNSGDVMLQNADCAEDFDTFREEQLEPGTVVVLDEGGRVTMSTASYDKRVAGVVSGAGDYKPGIVLDKKASSAHRIPVALMGKVYCKVDAQYGPIEAGDLLTTSPTPGYAMKADDRARAFGAVIGKAMRPLRKGKDLTPILVTLQ